MSCFKRSSTNAAHRTWGTAIDRLKDLVHPSIEVMAEHLADRYDRARVPRGKHRAAAGGFEEEAEMTR